MELFDVLYARKTGGGSGGGATVIDLKEYYSGSDSFNNWVLFTLMSAVEKNGEWVRQGCVDTNFALRDAFKGKKNVIMQWTYNDLNADISAPACVVSTGDRVLFVSAAFSTYLQGSLVDMQLAIAWDMAGSSNDVSLFLKTTLATI
jgi:hypothetical protein